MKERDDIGSRPRRPPRLGTLLIALALVACGGADGPGDEPGQAAGDASGAPTNTSSTASLSERPDGLQATIDVDEQTVRGRFRSLRFEARLTGESKATARFERIEGMTLISTIEGPKEGTLEWQGATLDGFGAATAEELEAMAHFADRLKADELALIPLDLACRPGAEELDPAIGAVLVLPWQMLLKYQPEGEIPTPPEAAAESQCQHLRSPLDAVDPQRTPSPSVVELSGEQPVPMAFGYLPFDLEGFPQPSRATEDGDDA